MDELKISLFIGLVVLMALLIIAVYYTMPSYESFRVTQEMVDYSNDNDNYVDEEIPDEKFIDEPEQQDKDDMVDPKMHESVMVPIDQNAGLPPQEETEKVKLNVLKFKLNANVSLTQDKLDSMKSNIVDKFNEGGEKVLLRGGAQFAGSQYDELYKNSKKF